MQDHSDDEVAKGEQNQVHLLQLAQPQEAAQQQPPDQDEQAEKLMSISASAYGGKFSESTISVSLKTHNATTLALADTGSTTTFMVLGP
jgi:hypothetical protein